MFSTRSRSYLHRVRTTIPAAALSLLLVGSSIGPVPTATAAQDDVLLVLVPGASEVRYRAHEQLLGRSAPNEAVGRARSASGQVVLAADGTFVPEVSRISIDLRPLRSDESRRDNVVQSTTLQTAQFPTAELVPDHTLGLPLPLPTDGQVTFQLAGALTVHGATQPTVWDVTANLGEQEVAGLAVTRVRMTDFGMTPPQIGPVLSIEDELTLEIEFDATRAPAAALKDVST